MSVGIEAGWTLLNGGRGGGAMTSNGYVVGCNAMDSRFRGNDGYWWNFLFFFSLSLRVIVIPALVLAAL
jgi:hypothetical protein